MPPKEFNEILRATVGSNAHGLSLAGTDDMDLMAVAVETQEQLVGLSEPFETYVWRSAWERTGNPGARSEAGDTDLTVFGLRKYLRLALKGNPTVLIPLFATPASGSLLKITRLGYELQDLAPKIVSRRAIAAFLGYLTAQKERLLGVRGQKRVNRPELVEKYGFDTKFAMHAIRLGFQGVELAETGRLSLPMREPEREFCRAVRTGQVGLVDVVAKIEALEQQLAAYKESGGVLSDEPDTATVEAWALNVWRESWTGEGK